MARRESEAKILRLGAISLVVMLLALAASFNLGKMPGLAGTTYTAELADASGLHKGNMVQVGGIRSGRVKSVELTGDRVLVSFEVDNDVEFGTDTRASVEVLNLLGEKYLKLEPDGPGQQASDEVIPLARTESAYDIVGVLGDLATTTERIDTDQLQGALTAIGETLDASGPEIQESFRGISRLSRTIASRDQQLQTLLKSSHTVSKILSARSKDIVKLMEDGDLVFQELRKRKQAIHRLLIGARSLSKQLRGIATDNRAEIGTALKEVDELTSLLIRKEKQVKELLHNAGPYANILSNVIGTGPWFDVYVVNLASIPTGEFVPGTGDF